MKHTLMALFCIIFWIFVREAQASTSFFGRPNKLITCELMLNGGLRGLTEKDSILPVLRDFKHQLQNTYGMPTFDGTYFENTSYSGPLEKMSKSKVRKIIARLNGIEENLVNRSFDEDIYSLEIRGADVEKARQFLAQEEENLRQTYEGQLNKVWSPMGRVGSYFWITLLGLATFNSAHEIINQSSSLDFNGFLHSLFPVYFIYTIVIDSGGNALKYHRSRFDYDFFDLKGFLSETALHPKDIFVSGQALTLPFEFHNMVFGDPSFGEEEARNLALKSYGGTFYTKSIYETFTSRKRYRELMNRITKNSGDHEREIYLDHLAYFDEQTQEPVWVFIYRAFRKKPEGHKPTPANQVSQPTLQQNLITPIPKQGP